MLLVGHRQRGPSRFLLPSIAYGLPLFFIVAPLAGFLTYSFFWVEGGQMHYQLTLLNYRRFFVDAVFLPVLLRTCLLCFAVAVLTVCFGYPVAFLLARLAGRLRYGLLMLVLVPLLMSYVIKIYAIRSILGGYGFLNQALLWLGLIDEPLKIFVFNLNAVLLSLTVLLIPFAILPIFLALERIPRALLEASADLGASNFQTFARIVAPLSLPGVMTALSFVFVLAIGDFLTPQMVGGQSGFTFGRIVYSQFGTAFNWPFGAALSAILAMVVIFAIAVAGRFDRRRETPS
ncbi:MAG: ABC transporter permease [Pseudomonadota bacterium]|nr:ABC transporter permease [Pseudomonadota bacterium]